MREVNIVLAADADAKAIWPVLADFAGFLEWAGEGEIRIEGDGIGMVRHLNMGGLEIAERLIELDEEHMTIGYALVYGEPIGMNVYQALVQVVALEEGTAELKWHGQFEAVDPAEEAQVAEALTAAFQGMTDALVVHVSN